MKGILRNYKKDFNKEVYELKFKDTPTRSGYQINSKDDEPMTFSSIRIFKLPKKNNHIVVELIL